MSLGQHVFPQQEPQAMRPGIVGVAAYIDAADRHVLARAGLLHNDVDVEYQVADLLHPAIRDEIGTDHARDRQLASPAIAQRPQVRRCFADRRCADHPVAAGILKLVSQRLAEPGESIGLDLRRRLQ